MNHGIMYFIYPDILLHGGPVSCQVSAAMTVVSPRFCLVNFHEEAFHLHRRLVFIHRVGGDWNMTFIFPYIGKNYFK